MKFKNDAFKKSRGGYSRLLDISCDCGRHLFYYQKDGPGPLKRMYLDRILKSEKYSGLETAPINKVPQLVCPDCKELLAVPYIYKIKPVFQIGHVGHNLGGGHGKALAILGRYQPQNHYKKGANKSVYDQGKRSNSVF